MYFSDCEVGDGAVLGGVGKGFEYAQIRLDPARLTHCMRWLGIAVRSMEIAARYALERFSFGKKLPRAPGGATHGLRDARRTPHDLARRLEARLGRVRHEVSMTKAFVAQVVYRVVDRVLQSCGALGVSEDAPLSHFFRKICPFRVYDGPAEVHKGAVARRVFRRAARWASSGDDKGNEPVGGAGVVR